MSCAAYEFSYSIVRQHNNGITERLRNINIAVMVMLWTAVMIDKKIGGAWQLPFNFIITEISERDGENKCKFYEKK